MQLSLYQISGVAYRRVPRREKRMRAGRVPRPEKHTKQRRFYISYRRGYANGGSLRIKKRQDSETRQGLGIRG